MGHVIDWKYRGGWYRGNNSINGACDAGSEEGKSLGEAIAGLYALMIYLQEFPYAQFTAFGTDGAQYLTGVGNYPDHVNSTTIKCYRGPGMDCSPSGYYEYSYPLMQAYFEAARGVNCGGDSCWVMNDGAGTDQARWALFYAMQVTPLSSSYQNFVAHFLTYYYNAVGYNQYANRWWVFNHHSLIGPKYGYSPCHAY